MEFAEIGLLLQGQGGQERIEIVPTKDWEAEKFVEGPKGGEGNEEQSDGPEVIEMLQVAETAGP